MNDCILAIDQGTTNTKALLVNREGAVLSSASQPVDISYPQPAWVEQDPEAIWQSVCQAVDQCLSASPALTPMAVGVSNQRETVLVWERANGRPLGPCVVWQCRRTAPFCEELRRRGAGELILRKTGLTVDPLFSASKLRWLLDHIGDGQARAEAGELAAGTIDSWVLWRLTGGATHACDFTNASRTQLFSLQELDWDPELLEVFGVPRPLLPQARPSSSLFGQTFEIGCLPAGIPVGSLIGDSHAAYFGHASFAPGAIKATYGTGSSLMMSTTGFVHSRRGLSSTIAFAVPGAVFYALEGNISVTGAAVRWLGEFLQLTDGAAGVARLAESESDNGGVYLVPSFVGLGAPHWNDRARGLLTGMTLGTGQPQVARATLESIAFQIHDVYRAMEEDTALELPELRADGGASRNDQLMQFQADILGRPVLRARSLDLSALGAAFLAGLSVGAWSSLKEIEELPRALDRFEPRMTAAERSKQVDGWKRAVARAVAGT
jgi:glycerol kinase